MPRLPPKRRASEARRNGTNSPISPPVRIRDPTGERSAPRNVPVLETIDLTSWNSPATSRPQKIRTNIVISLDSDTSFEVTCGDDADNKEAKACPRTVSPDVVVVNHPPVVEKVYPLGDCPICFDVLGKNQLASTRCGHVFCLHCLERSMTNAKVCPTCRKPLKGANSYHPLFIRIS